MALKKWGDWIKLGKADKNCDCMWCKKYRQGYRWMRWNDDATIQWRRGKAKT